MAEQKADLTFATFEEISEELNRRYDAVIILVEKDTTVIDTTTQYTHCGPYTRCIGMAIRLKRLLVRKMEKGG